MAAKDSVRLNIFLCLFILIFFWEEEEEVEEEGDEDDAGLLAELAAGEVEEEVFQ